MGTAVAKKLIDKDGYYKMAEVGLIEPDENVELINGEIYKMSPSGNWHASVIQRLMRLFFREFKDSFSIRIQLPLEIDAYNEPEPDITIVNFRTDDYRYAHPKPDDVLLLVEVSESSYSFDYDVKLPIYAGNKISEYWIVNLNKRRIEVYSEPSGNTYQKRKSYTQGEKFPFLDYSFAVSEILIMDL